MSTGLVLKRVFMPNVNINQEYTNFEKKLQPRMEVDNEELLELYREHEERIMAIVDKEITAYLEEKDLCNDGEGMFPRRCEMTGTGRCFVLTDR